MRMMHLNVETVTEVQGLMADSYKRMYELITALTGAVQGLESGAWVGNSATQFFADYETEKAKWKYQLEEMRVLTDRMKMEIEEWRDVASQIG